MLRILIASPYPAMRAGLHAILDEAGRGQVTVVGEADSVESCLEWVRAVQPHVVIFDLSLDGDDEMGGLWTLRSQSPSATVLALADADSDTQILTALQVGAQGCLSKTATGAEILEAAQSAMDGEPILPPSATSALLEHLRSPAPAESLTPRETEVLEHVASGLTNKAIALKLGISEHTVKFHLGSAMSKLGAASRAEAVAVAMRRGMISL